MRVSLTETEPFSPIASPPAPCQRLRVARVHEEYLYRQKTRVHRCASLRSGVE
eukprot:IDg19752t1